MIRDSIQEAMQEYRVGRDNPYSTGIMGLVCMLTTISTTRSIDDVSRQDRSSITAFCLAVIVVFYQILYTACSLRVLGCGIYSRSTDLR